MNTERVRLMCLKCCEKYMTQHGMILTVYVLLALEDHCEDQMLPEMGTVLVPTYTPGGLENCPKELNGWSTSRTAERCLAVFSV